jgi:hypothetical protein
MRYFILRHPARESLTMKPVDEERTRKSLGTAVVLVRIDIGVVGSRLKPIRLKWLKSISHVAGDNALHADVDEPWNVSDTEGSSVVIEPMQ